jgi:anti-anti-sigma factor
MEITKSRLDDVVTLTLQGRLDGNGAEHLDREVDELVHAGTRQIRLDLVAVSYLSSAGIRILVKCRKALAAIGGECAIAESSDFVRDLLKQTGLSALMVSGPRVVAAPQRESVATAALDGDRFVARTYALGSDGVLSCRMLGSPPKLAEAGYSLADAVPVALAPSTTGLGIGAFGENLEDCQGRFGEALAVHGTAVYQPTDGARSPDFMVSRGEFVPTLQTLHGLFWTGRYRSCVRFDSKTGEDAIRASTLLRHLAEQDDQRTIGFVMLAETAGLLGAVLRRPPLARARGTIFDHPDVTEWIAFAAERVHRRTLTLSVGVATLNPPPTLAPCLRPLHAASGLTGHVHSVAFSYRTLPEGLLNMAATIEGLFDTQEVLGVLHLLNDERDLSGAGESEFYRGAVWVGPLRAEAGMTR